MSTTLKERVSGAVDSAINKFYGVEVHKGDEVSQEIAFTNFLEKAKNSIQIVSGRFPEDFYTSRQTIGIFEKVVASGGTVEIIFSGKYSKKNMEQNVRCQAAKSPRTKFITRSGLRLAKITTHIFLRHFAAHTT